MTNMVPHGEVDWMTLILRDGLLLRRRVDTTHQMDWLLCSELTDQMTRALLLVEVELLCDVRDLVLHLPPLLVLKLEQVYHLSSEDVDLVSYTG